MIMNDVNRKKERSITVNIIGSCSTYTYEIETPKYQRRRKGVTENMASVEKYKEYLLEQQDKLNNLLEDYKNTLSTLYHADSLITSYYKEHMAILNNVFADILEINSEIETLKYVISAKDTENEEFSDDLPF